MPRPSGTVSFVFTDIQGSTHLWEHQRAAMQRAFRRHEEIVRSAMAAHGGYVYKMIGDAFQVAFATAKDALLAALEAQKNLHAEKWDENITEIKVRMALHSGVTEERGDDYLGPVLNRVARLLNTGHGGQVLLTDVVYQLVRDDLPEGITLHYLGEYRLKDLIQPENVYQATGPGQLHDFPPLQADGARHQKLPAQSTPFIGRDAELARIHEMLGDPACRLVTVLGMGGSGKTRLAIRAAEESLEFTNGVYYCGLEHVDSVQGLILAIAEAVNLPLISQPSGSITAENTRLQVCQFLSGKNLLLVLDNFEQLVFCADLVGDFLDTAVEFKIIVTSRHRLNLPGEWVMEIGGLSYPAFQSNEPLEGFSAVQLFVKTAERNSFFHFAPDDWSAIVRICRFLEGIPLGLEMAAAWTRTLSCAEIAEEIERDQDFLATSWRGMPDRHQSLRSVFDHSWRLLSGTEQAVFSRLSIFQGGFNREAALVVAHASLASISAFVDKALVRRISSGRFEIHPLLRRYSAEKLSANPATMVETHSRMADYYTGWLISENEKLISKDYLIGLAAIRGEIANIQVSLEWMVKQVDVERLSRILPAWILYQVMNDRRFEMQEASRLIVDLINQLRPRITTPDSLDAILLALAYSAVRFFCMDVPALKLMETYQIESIRLIKSIPDHIDKPFALLLNCTGPGTLSPTEMAEYCYECIRLFDQFANPWGSAMAYLALGDSYTFASWTPDEARAAYTRSLHDFTHLESEWGRALCISGLMYLESKAGNLEESYQHGKTCLEIFAEMGSFERMVSIRQNLAEISEQLGNVYEAAGFYQANLAHFVRRGDEAIKLHYQTKLAELTGKTGLDLQPGLF